MHDKRQKVKIRRRGESIRRKARTLGEDCNIISIVMYWNPIHQRMETEVHISPGQKLPDLNKLLDSTALEPDAPVSDQDPDSRPQISDSGHIGDCGTSPSEYDDLQYYRDGYTARISQQYRPPSNTP
ncbi:hypothetical protein BJ170DRAFT_600509 [Xylariales sp. AK1849]|nr:hypothetical protein BJ170DRAFT_600509 [Xylariales sp. AK1849]